MQTINASSSLSSSSTSSMSGDSDEGHPDKQSLGEYWTNSWKLWLLQVPSCQVSYHLKTILIFWSLRNLFDISGLTWTGWRLLKVPRLSKNATTMMTTLWLLEQPIALSVSSFSLSLYSTTFIKSRRLCYSLYSTTTSKSAKHIVQLKMCLLSIFQRLHFSY